MIRRHSLKGKWNVFCLRNLTDGKDRKPRMRLLININVVITFADVAKCSVFSVQITLF